MTSTQLAADPAGVSREELDRLVGGVHHDPHSVLGLHPVRMPTRNRRRRSATADSRRQDAIDQVAAGRPDDGAEGHTAARSSPAPTRPRPARAGWSCARCGRTPSRVAAVFGDRRVRPARRCTPAACSPRLVPGPAADYQLEVTYRVEGGAEESTWSTTPYRWLPTLGEIDLHLISEGRHERLWDALGAHVRTYDTPHGPVSGTSFAVWAPNARGVRVIGDFDYWQRRAYPMRSLGSQRRLGDLRPGRRCRARSTSSRSSGRTAQWRDKADPMAFATERTAGDRLGGATTRYDWDDDEWLAKRGARPAGTRRR